MVKNNLLLPVLMCLLGAGTVILANHVGKSQATFSLTNPCPYNYTGPVPNPEDCFSFYLCNQGYPELMICPVNLCYNPANEQCDHCNNVPGCEDDWPPPTRPPPTNATTTTPRSTRPPSTSTTTPRSTRPPSTTTTTPRSTRPPSTTTTTPRSTRPPSTTTTTPRSTRPPSTTTTTERSTQPDLSCPDMPYIKMPYPGDCRRFYICVNGNNVGIESCNFGLWFHFQQQDCVYPWADECW